MKDKRYYIYHVPGKKIGMTSNINKRVVEEQGYADSEFEICLLYTSPSPRDRTRSRMPSSA